MKAIETIYKGYRFRSRLEARWAVFFDTAKIEWQYEPEGFLLKNKKMYLPDFFLPNVSLRSTETNGVYIEIKPTPKEIDIFTNSIIRPPDDEGYEFTYFDEPLVAFAGLPPGLDEWQQTSGYQISQGFDNFMIFMKCLACGHVKIEYNEGNYYECPRCCYSKMDCSDLKNGIYENDIFYIASNAAKSARFEYGENGLTLHTPDKSHTHPGAGGSE